MVNVVKLFIKTVENKLILQALVAGSGMFIERVRGISL